MVSAETAAAVTLMLESVVGDDGTGGRRASRATGSPARPAPPSASTATAACYRGYTASFIGLAPADDPAVVVAVLLQRPKKGHYGGASAGPVFATS